ncbi:MAG: chemotaxis protein CheX [Mycobacterium leprae]
MRADILNAFLLGAMHTLSAETKGPVQRTGLNLDGSDQIHDEVTVYIALVGGLRGVVLVGMPTETARRIASTMMGESLPELTEMGFSALAELGNQTAGRAMIELERVGFTCDITPPTIMIGQRARISTLGLPRFVIPLETPDGPLHIHVAADVVPV